MILTEVPHNQYVRLLRKKSICFFSLSESFRISSSSINAIYCHLLSKIPLFLEYDLSIFFSFLKYLILISPSRYLKIVSSTLFVDQSLTMIISNSE